MHEQSLLIIDDEEDMLEGLKRVLSYELAGVEVVTDANPLHALELIRTQRFDLILLDIRMPQKNGMDLLVDIRLLDPHVTLIMMTAYGNIETAVESIRRGAYDFVTKPFEIADLVRVIKKGLERNQLIRENLNLRAKIGQDSALQHFVGETPPMRRLYETIQTLARTDYTVLIRGQSGTGKELVARALHSLSIRGARPLLAVNCPAIPEHLLESELFGHRKGAFTGADTDHVGLFEEANGSSLLLDEIGDLPVNLQTKLLRVLQEQELRPLGGIKNKKIDVRILASTNQNLERRIAERKFRQDLFYRLNVVTVQTPALSEIREDIPLLVDHLNRKFAGELGIPIKRFSMNALEELKQRQWPGNVRELQNVVRRILLFCQDEVVQSTHLHGLEHPGMDGRLAAGHFENEPTGVEPYIQARDRLLEGFTREYVQNLLGLSSGNITRAAQLAGLSRVAMQKILRRTGIDPAVYQHQKEPLP
ncbi:sigma-54-dependent transcriptional regulator [Desulfobulbus alkaliphilus]|uniref:sigma-54-dependent transcriptional regulator n=1 Tax=Desulfobulbus alkaliphilus TaxID=869814 RepID=UPI001965E115|nr:sigma-54 dependent transcriptional regulator [Desulfobulbus alkaliphilus]MBM9538064.1 sigma-54-dependent Fis family transcriptional regulator [Desulfobulbus alkaliphilus]